MLTSRMLFPVQNLGDSPLLVRIDHSFVVYDGESLCARMRSLDVPRLAQVCIVLRNDAQVP